MYERLKASCYHVLPSEFGYNSGLGSIGELKISIQHFGFALCAYLLYES